MIPEMCFKHISAACMRPCGIHPAGRRSPGSAPGRCSGDVSALVSWVLLEGSLVLFGRVCWWWDCFLPSVAAGVCLYEVVRQRHHS
jgi:hypothetical protein